MNSFNNNCIDDLEKFKFIVEHTAEEFYQMRPDGSFAYINPAAARSLGYSVEEFLNLNVTDIDTTFDKDKFYSHFLELKEADLPAFESIHRHKNGNLQIKEIHSFYQKFGEEEFVCGFARDVTKRISEQKLHNENEELFRTIFNSSPIGLLMADKEGFITQINDAYITLLGGDPKKIDRKVRVNILNLEAFKLAGIQEHFTRLYQGIPFKLETSLPRSFFGKTVYLLYVAVPLFDNEGKVKGCVVNAKDITDRKLLEISLKEERNLFIGGPTVVFKWLPAEKHPVEYVSPNVHRLIGYTHTELLKSRTLFNELIHPEDLPILIADAKANAEKGILSYEQEYRLRRKDGSYCWVHDFTVVVKNIHEEVEHFNGYLNDISDRKKKEAAEIASKEKSKFLANMSHEIRNPLNVIIGISRLLSRSELNPKQKSLVESLSVSSQHLMSLVNDVLDFSKIESGKVEIKMLDFSISEMMDSLYEMFVKETKRKKLNFSFDVAPEINNHYTGDYGKIFQIIVNLISNSIKFTQSGYIKVIVRLKNSSEDVEEIEFEVKDTGIGIKGDDILQIFESFTQIDQSTTKEYKGTGLGLAIVKNYVRLMGGDVSVESVYGKGSSFRFYIPLNKSAESFETEVNNAAAHLSKTVNVKILVVEDDRLNLMYLSEFLKEKGMDVYCASNGAEAVDKTGIIVYDAILMDGQMPVMDGFTATRIIRKDENNINNKTPIIAITGYATAGDENQFIESGMNAYITKPINENELISVINEFRKK